MAVEVPSWAISAASHSAALVRQSNLSQISGTGVVGVGDLACTATGASLVITIAPGTCWAPGTAAGGSTTGFHTNLNAQTAYGLMSSFTSQGPYFTYNDANATVTLSSGGPTFPRIDLIYLAIQDAQYTGSNNQPVLGAVTGGYSGGASPVIPAAPANALVLAQVAVAANAPTVAQGNVTDERPFLNNGPNIFAPIPVLGTVTMVSGGHYIVSTGTPPLTLPTPYKSARVKVTNSGSGAPTVAQSAAEKIYGLGLTSSGVNSIWLQQYGGSATLESDGTSWYLTGGNPGWTPGTPLGSLTYYGTAGSYSITATTLTAVDTTNLRLSNIIGPPSGDIRVRLSAPTQQVASTAAYFGVLNGASALTQGYIDNGSGLGTRSFYEAGVTGLTSGTNYSLDFAAWVSSAGSPLTIYHGPASGSYYGPIDFVIYAS